MSHQTNNLKMSFFAGRTAAHQARASFARGGRFSMHSAPPRPMPRQTKVQTNKKPSVTTWPTSKTSPYVCFANLAQVQNLNRLAQQKPLGASLSTLAIVEVKSTEGGETTGELASSSNAGAGQQGILGVIEAESDSEVTNSRRKLRKHVLLPKGQVLLGWNWWDEDC
jgi:hypothetical protein